MACALTKLKKSEKEKVHANLDVCKKLQKSSQVHELFLHKDSKQTAKCENSRHLANISIN